MTYCLALRLDEGLVFLADTRTNAGLDNVGVDRKLHVLRPAPDRVFVLESAGNLATTQEVLDRIQRDLDIGAERSLATVDYLFEAALYIGGLSRDVAETHRTALGTAGSATFILGGQIAGAPADIMLVYSQGNYIRASEDRPFLQIGETKYGKFMLELAVTADVGLVTAVKIALGSMMSTSLASLSVGPPYDIAVCRHDALDVDVFRVTSDSPLLARLKEVWEKHVLNAIADLPGISSEYFGEHNGGDQLDGNASAAAGSSAASDAPRSRRSK